MSTTITLSQAYGGFLLHKRAEGRSPHTIAEYEATLKKLQLHFEDDPNLDDLSVESFIGFFAWLQNEYVSRPDGVADRGKIRLSSKSVYNVHANLSAFCSWAFERGLFETNLMRVIDRPRYSQPVIEPFSEEDIRALIGACDLSRSWKSKKDTASTRPTAKRDIAIILTLLDTGSRASELCQIQFQDLNLQSGAVRVRGKGPGRETKERIVRISRRTGDAIWGCLAPRLEDLDPHDPIFVVGSRKRWRPMNRNVLGKQLRRLGEKAGVANVHPHRFRHTFALMFLRNGGNMMALQDLLGHSDMKMVRRYVRLAAVDLEAAHKTASPVANMKLP